MSPGLRRLVAAAAVVLFALVAPLFGAFWVTVFTVAIVYVLASLSLVVLTGWSGQLNLHVAALGLGWGAYSAYALISFGIPVAVALIVAGLVTIPFAALVGAIAVRFRGLELAVATLAIGLIFEQLAFRNIGRMLAARDANITTFESSFVPMPRPSVGGASLAGDAPYFLFCLAVAVAVFLLAGNLGRSRFGRTLRAVREREAMAETLGIPVLRYRVAAFAISIMIASTAGALLAALKLGVTPDSFNIDLSFRLLAAAVIGGIHSAGGAIVGGAVAALLPEVVQFGPLKLFSGERLFVLFGAGMVLALWRLPEGLAGAGRRLFAKRAAGPDLDADATPRLAGIEGTPRPRRYATPVERHIPRTLLRASGIRVRFGGVVALDGVDLSVPTGEIAALIGPNGAGKSTLFNCVSGLLQPDDGRLYYRGEDVTELPANARAALGIGRTFQTVEVFRQMTVRDNLAVAGYRLAAEKPVAEALRLPSARRGARMVEGRARHMLALLDLEDVADRRAGDLPLGLLRVLELGMALIPDPSLLLLDEPSAGMDPRETAAFGTLVHRAREEHGLTVLLVEHDMSLVASLAEQVFVLDFGRIIAQGTPEEVRTNPIVLERYLGSADVPDAKEVALARG